MSCRTETHEIDMVDYSITQWPAEKAMIMKFRLLKCFGPAMASLIELIGDNNDVDGDSLSSAIENLFSKSSPDELSKMIKDCVVGVAKDGTRITESSFNQIFSGDELVNVYKIFILVVRVNFGNLLTGQQFEEVQAKLTQINKV